MLTRVLYATTLAMASASASDPWEWAGAFELADASHNWVMQKVNCVYADASMKVIVIPTTSPTQYELLAQEGPAAALFEGACTDYAAGSTLTPAASGSCFNLVPNQASDDSEWSMNTAGLSGMLVYTEHVPTEFERDMHYLHDSSETDIEPVAWPHRWGPAIGASLIVNLVTLTGVILAIPGIRTLYERNPDCFGAIANAFAAGALISCAFYLMLFEGSHYIPVAGEPEATTAFLWGTAVLLGVITASIIDLITCAIMPSAQSVTDKDGTVTTNNATRVRCGVLVGDFMHNLCDGFFIGTAFTSCSDALAWNITLATILHEIAQEISDYFVLTDPKQGNLKPVLALALNFVSGVSVLLGAVIVMSLGDGLDNRSIGMILTFGGGVYLQIGCAECMGRMYAQAKSVPLKSAAILVFCLGALAIGLVLLDHQHCNAGGGDGHDHGGGDAHAGHNHGRMLSQLFDTKQIGLVR